LSEVLILHLGHGDENLWNKLVDLLDENGYQINHLETVNKTSKLLKFDGLEIMPEQHQCKFRMNGTPVTLQRCEGFASSVCQAFTPAY